MLSPMRLPKEQLLDEREKRNDKPSRLLKRQQGRCHYFRLVHSYESAHCVSATDQQLQRCELANLVHAEHTDPMSLREIILMQKFDIMCVLWGRGSDHTVFSFPRIRIRGSSVHVNYQAPCHDRRERHNNNSAPRIPLAGGYIIGGPQNSESCALIVRQ